MLAPYRGRSFYVFHPGFGYFADAYGLKEEAIEAGGREPTPSSFAPDRKGQGRRRQDGLHPAAVRPAERAGRRRRDRRPGGSINGLAKNVIADIEDIAAKIEKAMKEGKSGTGGARRQRRFSVPCSTEPVISLRDVTFSYGGAPALEDVNLSVGEREAVCIVGPNGGGKTTLVKLILGLLTPQRGEVRVFGQPPEPGKAPRRLHAAARPARPAVPRHRDGHRADGPAGARRDLAA